MFGQALHVLLLLGIVTPSAHASPFHLFKRDAQNNNNNNGRGRSSFSTQRTATPTADPTTLITTAATSLVSSAVSASLPEPSTLASTAAPPAVTSVNGALQVNFVNTLGSATLKAWIVGVVNGASTFVGPGGQLTTSQSSATISVPSAGVSVSIPSWITSGRIFFADTTTADPTLPLSAAGMQPSLGDTGSAGYRLNWGFVELTTTSSQGLFANLANVDFVGMPVGISANGQTAKGVPADGVSRICSTLRGLGGPWSSLCVTPSGASSPLRVLAPFSNVNSGFSNYWEPYVNRVWSSYSGRQLNIDTQSSLGVVPCSFSSTSYTCLGQTFPKPTSNDIWGCASGPFASSGSAIASAQRARVCAAFHRSTLLIDGGSSQPGPAVSSYYGDSVTNHYAKAVHATQLDGRGYAFSFDDVGPNGAGGTTAGVLTGAVGSLTVTIGGWK